MFLVKLSVSCYSCLDVAAQSTQTLTVIGGGQAEVNAPEMYVSVENKDPTYLSFGPSRLALANLALYSKVSGRLVEYRRFGRLVEYRRFGWFWR